MEKYKTPILIAAVIIVAVIAYMLWKKRKGSESPENAPGDPGKGGGAPGAQAGPVKSADTLQPVAGVETGSAKNDLKAKLVELKPQKGQTVSALAVVTNTYNAPNGTLRNTVTKGTVLGTATGKPAPAGWVEIMEPSTGKYLLKGPGVCYVKSTDII